MIRKGKCWDNAVAERFFLSLKMERVWQGNTLTTLKPISTLLPISSVSTTANACTQFWVICRPPFTNGTWQQKNLSLCPNLLDHHSWTT